MSSPIFGDNLSHAENEQMNSKHMPLEKHNTSPPVDTSDPNPTDNRDSTGHIVRAKVSVYHEKSPRVKSQDSTGWGPEFFPKRKEPGSPTEMNSPTRYEEFALVPQMKALRIPSRSTGPTRKSRRRRKPTQLTVEPRRSERISVKLSENSKGMVAPQKLRRDRKLGQGQRGGFRIIKSN
ncbi:hypothetical protein B0T10DRAFT_463320 [Thelonectria olida]|uniref:Uncharacterized protein n=1 Tax=Thelonectria olida TaxID=1576542 RepID=A0A9P9ALX4_9HYPO|nr:hypothetical protein B0T10DRAFT_463320 [Thelonectria olida]